MGSWPLLAASSDEDMQRALVSVIEKPIYTFAARQLANKLNKQSIESEAAFDESYLKPA